MLVRRAYQPAVGVPSLRGPIAASVAGKAVELATLVLLATLIPRVLGPSDYGRFAVALTIVTLASLALTLGGPALVTRYVPAAPRESQVPLARALGAQMAREAGTQLCILAGAAAAVAVAFRLEVPWPETVAVAVAVALNVGATVALLVILGLGRAGAWSTRYPLQNVALIALVLGLSAVSGVGGALAAIPLSAAGAVLFAALVARPVLRADTRALPELPAGAARFGRLQAAGAALTQVTHRGGVVVVALLAGSAIETGFSALALGIAVGLTYAIVQIFTVSLPTMLASSTTDAATSDTERALTRVANGVLVFIVPATLIAAVLLDRLVPTVFGSDYAAASTAFGPALALVVLAPLAALTVNVASVRLRPEVVTVSGAVSVVVFGVVALATVRHWGATASTSAALAGVAAGAVVALAILRGIPSRVVLISFAAAAGVLAITALT